MKFKIQCYQKGFGWAYYCVADVDPQAMERVTGKKLPSPPDYLDTEALAD